MIDHAASPMSAIVALNADILDDLERVRMANEARLRSLLDPEWGKGVSRELAFEEVGRIEELISAVKIQERDAIRHLEAAMRRHEIGGFVQATPGLGLKTVARYLGAVGPLHARETVNQIYAYTGLHVVDGRAPRPTRGRRLGFSAEARKRAFCMAEPCIKAIGFSRTSKNGKVSHIARSPYRDVYEAGRAKYANSVARVDYVRYDKALRRQAVYLAAGEPLPDWLQHARAIRLVMKAIVGDLWVEARRAHDLPTGRRKPAEVELEAIAA